MSATNLRRVSCCQSYGCLWLATGQPPKKGSNTAPPGARGHGLEAPRDQAVFTSLALEAFTEVGMGKRDQHPGPFGDRAALEVGDAIFSDDIHHVRPRGGDDVARGQVEHDAAAALALLLVGRRQ